MLIASGKSPITYTSGTLFRIIPRARGGGISNVFMANPRFGRTVRIPQVVTATITTTKKLAQHLRVEGRWCYSGCGALAP